MMGIASGLIGFSEGVVVGGVLAAFITVLDLVSRLCWISGTIPYIFIYEVAIVAGATLASILYLIKPVFYLGRCTVAMLGFFMGVFIGMVAAALAEVMNVLPVITRRLGIQEYIGIVFVLLVIGKVVGSLVYWIFPTIWN